MDTQTFINAYSESRNGANGYYRHAIVRTFRYTDGVAECAEAGCYWLLDIIATECVKPMRLSQRAMGTVEVVVANDAATLRLTVEDDAPAIWTREVEYTDLPEGRWIFYLGNESTPTATDIAMCLPNEY